jgi:hypothetical protein
MTARLAREQLLWGFMAAISAVIAAVRGWALFG